MSCNKYGMRIQKSYSILYSIHHMVVNSSIFTSCVIYFKLQYNMHDKRITLFTKLPLLELFSVASHYSTSHNKRKVKMQKMSLIENVCQHEKFNCVIKGKSLHANCQFFHIITIKWSTFFRDLFHVHLVKW